MNLAPAALLVALQHADSQFPSGSFAFSQGLEALSLMQAELGPLDFAGFVEDQLLHRWAGSDRVALVRAHRAGGRLDRLAALDREVEASTIQEALREGSRRNGMALLTTHARLATHGAAAYRIMVRGGKGLGHLAIVQGLAWHALGMDEETAVLASGYQAVASLATAAVRLGLIGAIEAQAHVAALLPVVASAAVRPVGDDEVPASFIPLTEIAIAMRGGGQRLFSN